MEKIIGDTYLVKTRGKHKNKRGVYDHLTAKGRMSLKFNNGSEEAYEPDSLIHCKGIKQNKQKNNKKITMAKTKEPTKEAKLKEASAAAVDDNDDTNILAKAFQETLQLALERQYKMIMEDVQATIQPERAQRKTERDIRTTNRNGQTTSQTTERNRRTTVTSGSPAANDVL